MFLPAPGLEVVPVETVEEALEYAFVKEEKSLPKVHSPQIKGIGQA